MPFVCSLSYVRLVLVAIAWFVHCTFCLSYTLHIYATSALSVTFNWSCSHEESIVQTACAVAEQFLRCSSADFANESNWYLRHNVLYNQIRTAQYLCTILREAQEFRFWFLPCALSSQCWRNKCKILLYLGGDHFTFKRFFSRM